MLDGCDTSEDFQDLNHKVGIVFLSISVTFVFITFICLAIVFWYYKSLEKPFFVKALWVFLVAIMILWCGKEYALYKKYKEEHETHESTEFVDKLQKAALYLFYIDASLVSIAHYIFAL